MRTITQRMEQRPRHEDRNFATAFESASEGKGKLDLARERPKTAFFEEGNREYGDFQ